MTTAQTRALPVLPVQLAGACALILFVIVAILPH
jgi:hypothetical protein